VRTTGVRLIAEYSVFKRGFADAKKDVKDFKDEVDKLDGSGRKAGEGLDKASLAANKVGQDLGQTATAGRQASASLDNVGKSASGMGAEFAKAGKASRGELDQMRQRIAEVDRQIAVTKRNLSGFAAALSGGNRDAGLLKAFSGEQKNLSLLKNIKSALPDPSEFAKEGAKDGEGFWIGFMKIPKPVAAGLAVALAPALPMLGAAISGAVLGAGGVGGVAGGLYLASKDSRVRSAASALATDLSNRLQLASGGFVDAAIAGLNDLRRVASTINFEGLLGDASKFVGPLERGVAVAAQRIAAGLQKAFSQSAPVMDAWARTIANVGGAIGDMFQQLSAQSSGSAAGVNELTDALVGFVQGTSTFLAGLAQLEGGLHSADQGIDKARYSVEDFIDKLMGGNSALDLTADGYKRGSEAADLYRKGVIGAAGSVNDYSHYLREQSAAQDNATTAAAAGSGALLSFDDRMQAATAATKAFSDAIHSAFSDQLQLDQATLALANGAKTLRDELTHGTRTLSLNSAEGRANRGAVLQQLAAIEALRQARFNETGSVQQADAEYKRNFDALRRSMLQAGFTKREVDALIGSYKKVPGKVNTVIGTPGLPQSDAGIKNYGKKLDALARTIRTQITVVGKAAAEGQLRSLLIQQQALKKGISVSAATSAFNKNAGDGYGVKGVKGHAAGGYTGPGTKYQPAGVVHAGEFVFSSEATSKIGVPQLDQLHRAARGYAGGGLVLNAPFPVNAAVTKVPSLSEALAVVAAAVPGGGGGPGYKWMERVARAAFPGIGIISDYRPGARTLSGNQSYHAIGRAVDFSPSMPFAEWVNAKYFKRTRELITPWQNLNIHNGARHHYSAAIEAQHSGSNAHDHWAMVHGGLIREPVFGVGASGDTYSFGERGPEWVVPSGMYGGGGGPGTSHITISAPITINGSNLSPQQIAAQVNRQLGALVDQYARTV
jgi:hypothetical protein